MITNPQVCGSYPATVSITPWTEPNQSAVNFNPNLAVTAGPNGGGCSFDAFNPGFSANVSDTGAGKHPNLTLTATRSDRQDNIQDMTFRFPNGFAGSVNAVTPCPAATAAAGTCTSSSQVGSVAVQAGTGAETVALNGTVHLTDAAPTEIGKVSIQVPVIVGPYDLGVTVMYASMVLNSTTTFGLDAVTLNMPQMIQGIPVRYRSVALSLNGIATQGTGSTADDKPFLQNPAVCGVQNWQATFVSNGDLSGPALPGTGSQATVVKTDSDQSTTGCPTTFNPSLSVTPSSTATATPTGLTVTVNVPQTTVGVTAATVQQSTVKRVLLTMPAGMEINPGFATGLTACSTANIDAGGGSCALSSRVGTVSLATPLLTGAQTGIVFIETPGGTPTTRYKLAIVVTLPSGFLVIRGTAQVNGSGLGVDAGTGQVTADFDNLPDVPFSSFSFIFNTGPGAMFTNPTTCAVQTFSAGITPHSTGGAVANRNATYTTTYDGAGAACPGTDPYNPTFAQSVSTTVAGAHPNLTLTVNRPDKDQRLRDMTFALPVGLTGAAAAAPTCTQVNADAGTCAANTQLGTITTSVGSGSQQLALSGTIHNTVAPANQPAKLTAIVPVVAGPYNLGSLSIPINVSLRSDMGLDVSVANLPQRFE
ncbi:MAG: hypothetical protein Q7V62_04480, partial [Actinomycetota bacterium]|nr:hypothetical protein [Actinomycetota bacterium]